MSRPLVAWDGGRAARIGATKSGEWLGGDGTCVRWKCILVVIHVGIHLNDLASI